MKFNIKKISVLGLAGMFLLSAMFCCCFTNAVQAKEPAPSCHQATDTTEVPQKAQDCDCDQSVVITKDATIFIGALIQGATLAVDQQKSLHAFTSLDVSAYQAPPLVNDTAPLYIKHSILRI